MEILITAREAINKDIWEELCELLGFFTWSVNEGLIESSHLFVLSEAQAIQLGLLKET